MTVYNVTKINRGLATAVAKFLKVPKVELRYSEWMNEFGVWVKNKSKLASVSVSKHKLANRYVNTKLMATPANELASCPKIISKYSSEYRRKNNDGCK